MPGDTRGISPLRLRTCRLWARQPAITGAGFALDTGFAGLPLSVAVGSNASFTVKFTPTAETLYNGSLRIPYSINGTNYTGTVTLRGSLGKPKIQVPMATRSGRGIAPEFSIVR